LQSLEQWVSINQNCANVAAAYIILGLALIGRQIENPFGDDVTDIDMDGYIRQLKAELNILTSKPPPKLDDFIATDENFPLGPHSTLPYSALTKMSVEGMMIFGLANNRNSRVSQGQSSYAQTYCR
jgi:ion channel-forming bestrophin family protein